jgi:ABC-type amino acid transport substrate-binding protein
MIRAIIIMIVFAFTLQAKAEELKELKVGVIEYPPFFVFPENAKPHGALLDFLNEKLSRKYRVEWMSIPLSRGDYSLQNDIVDVYLGFRKTDERKLGMDFGDKNLFELQPFVCGNKKNISFYKKRDRLFGNIVLPLKAKVPPELQKLESIKIEYKNYLDRAMAMIKNNRADLLLAPEIFAKENVLIKDDSLDCAAVGKPIGISLAFKSGSGWKNEIEALGIPSLNPIIEKAIGDWRHRQKQVNLK